MYIGVQEMNLSPRWHMPFIQWRQGGLFAFFELEAATGAVGAGNAKGAIKG